MFGDWYHTPWGKVVNSTVGHLFWGLQISVKIKFEDTIFMYLPSLQSAIHVMIGFPIIFSETSFMEVPKIHKICKICSPWKGCPMVQYEIIYVIVDDIHPSIIILHSSTSASYCIKTFWHCLISHGSTTHIKIEFAYQFYS